MPLSALRLHASTLRYRLERLQDLFGVDFENRAALFGLTLALRLRDLATEMYDSASIGLT